MKLPNHSVELLAIAIAMTAATAAPAAAAQGTPRTSRTPRTLGGVVCETPPPFHCGADGCSRDLLADQGNATEPKTGRKFFLDYPCDLKANEQVIVILSLSLHGAGSIGNWQPRCPTSLRGPRNIRATPASAARTSSTPPRDI
jgi:hypothetical protein